MKVRISLVPNKFAGGGEIPPYRTGDPSVLKRDLNNRVILPSFNDLFSNHRPEDIYEEEGYIPLEQGKGHQYTYNDIYTDYIGRLNKYNQSLPVNDSANILTNEKRNSQGLNRIGDTGAMPVVNDMFKGVNTLLGYGMQAPVELAKTALMPGSYIPYVGATNQMGELMSGAVDNTAGALFAPIMPSNYIDWGSAGRDGIHLKLPWQSNSNGVETPAFMQTMDFVAAPYLAKGVGKIAKWGKQYVNPFYEGRNQPVNLINDLNNIDLTGIDYTEDIMSSNSEKAISLNVLNGEIGKNIKNYGKTIADVINKAIKFDGASKFTRGIKGVTRSFNPKINKLLQVPGVMDYVTIYDIANKNGLDNISEVFNERYGKKPQSKYILDHSIHAFDTKESLLKIFDASEKGYEYELLIDRYAASLKNKAIQMYESITDPSLKHLIDTSPLYLEEVYTQLLKGKTSKEIIKNLVDKVNTYSRYMTKDVPAELARTLTEKLMKYGLDVEGILKSLDYGNHHYIFKGKPTLGNDYTTWWDNRIPKNTEASVGMHWYNPYDVKILRKINNDPIMKYAVFDTWKFNRSLGDAIKYYQYPAHLILKPKSGNVLTDFEVFKPIVGEGIETYLQLYNDPTNFSLGYKYGGNLFPDGGTLDDDDIPMYGSTQQEAVVTGHRMPAWNRFWNKNFRSKSGWDKYVDRYYARQLQMQDTNNTPNSTYEVPDALSTAGIIAGTPYNEDIERAKVWDTYNNWKEHSEIIGPHYDPDGNYHNDAYTNPSAGYLSNADPVGEFFVLNEALGPLAKFIGRGAQQVMARAGNQWARNQIMGRAFNNAADASFGFNNRFVTTPASSVGYEMKPKIIDAVPYKTPYSRITDIKFDDAIELTDYLRANQAAEIGKLKMENLLNSQTYKERVINALHNRSKLSPYVAYKDPLLQVQKAKLEIVPKIDKTINTNAHSGGAIVGKYNPNTYTVTIASHGRNKYDLEGTAQHEYAHASENEELLKLLAEDWKDIKPTSFATKNSSDSELKYITSIPEMRARAMSVLSEMKDKNIDFPTFYKYKLDTGQLDGNFTDLLFNFGKENMKQMVNTVYGLAPLGFGIPYLMNNNAVGINTKYGYKYGGNLFPNGGTLDDSDVPINSTLNTVNVYPTKIPGFQKWWNKTFRSKEGYYDWADRYADRHPQDTNTIIVNPEEHTIINQRDLIADNAKVLSESGLLPPLWDSNLTVGANQERMIQWQKNARENALHNQALQVAKNAEKGLYPVYDDESNIAQYLPYNLALDSNDKPLSGTDPVGEFFVLNEALGPLAKFIGRGGQQVMARLGNQQARNQIIGRTFNEAANITPEVTHFYHGSPVRFDKLSADFIGSGEGGSKVMKGINLWPEEKIGNAPKFANIKSSDAPLHLGVSSTPLGGELNPTVYDVSGKGLKLYKATPREIKNLSQKDLIKQGYDGVQTSNQVTVFPESISKLSIDKQSSIEDFIMNHPEVERWNPWTTDSQKMQNIIDRSKMSKWTSEQWTAAQDAAIAKGDMAEVQRLRDLHFNTFEKPQHYYRGSNSKRNTYFRDDGSAVWLTPDKDAAKFYAATPDNLRDLYVKLPKNIIEVDGKRHLYDDLLPWELPKEIQKVLPDAYKSYIRDKNYDFPLTTTDVAHYAKKAGYPVVKFKNVADATNGENPFYDQIATREYNNIKLADAVTYDDNGIRIPLGERDNFNINDIRYGLAPLGFGIPYLMNNNNNQ